VIGVYKKVMKKLILIICIILVTGCGFKGPLYLPKPEQSDIAPNKGK
jgi:predicted small lipoprotein YifL